MEDKAAKAKRTPWLAALALFLLIPASQAEWIWNRLYFQTQTAGEIAFAFAFYAFAIALAALVLTLALGTRVARQLLHGAIVLMLCVAVFNGLREGGYIPNTSPLGMKIAAVALALLAVWLALAKLRQEGWARLYPALIVACPLFALSPWMVAQASAPAISWPMPSSASSATLPLQNTMVLLLDELSAGSEGPIVARLREAGLDVSVTDIQPAGDDTINVIPAIWTHKDFARSAPCGPTALCSGGNVLDFAKVTATNPNIDVVAFYHQYCAMQGLRSCSFFPFPQKPALMDLTCELLKKPHFLPSCMPTYDERRFFAAQRNSLQNALMAAPFWRQGGILYGHLLQPHPLMGATDASLADEYAANIDNSAALVANLARKGQATFGKNFRLILFSDHPLRLHIWCGTGGFYHADRCKPEPGQLSTQVPLIVATPQSHAAPAIQSNQQVFDLLYTN